MTKKFTSFILAVLLMLSVFPAAAFAEDDEGESKLIDQIGIEEFAVPAYGDMNVYNLLPITEADGSKYNITAYAWCDYDSATDTCTLLGVFDKFGCGTYYCYFEVEPVEGYSFAEDVSVTINGSDELVDNDNTMFSDGKWYIYSIDFEICPSAAFSDAPGESHWAHEGIDFCIGNKIMGSTRTDKLTFEPETDCTRAMVVSMLYRISNVAEVKYANEFPDVKADAWYADAVAWAKRNNVVSGYDNGNFGPNDKVSREQLAVILMKYTQNVLHKDVSTTTHIYWFADSDKVTWSKEYMQWAVANGLISGAEINGKTYLLPKDCATREQVASIFMRYMKANMDY